MRSSVFWKIGLLDFGELDVEGPQVFRLLRREVAAQ